MGYLYPYGHSNTILDVPASKMVFFFCRVHLDLHASKWTCSVILMNNEIAEKIANTIDSTEGATRASVALASGIARNTFTRKMNGGGGDFTAYELARVAMALKTDPANLLPREFKLAKAG